jgi:glyoxylase-like metal-dependent hydrolase (beta-lactamase superfamily II)
MSVVPFIHEGLGNSSYLIGTDGGSAILVDPDRTVQRYLDAANARGWRIETVLETHLHADFVSGAHELAAAMGAKLFVPEGEGLRLPHQGVRGSERWTFEGLAVESIASPGHTPEHMSYVVHSGSQPPVLFSGGSLIVGGAARTDLISPEMTDPLTRAQYRTLKQAFAGLSDETLLYPTHGGGSFCSAGSGGSRTSTLGAERSSNPLLAFDSEDEFAAWFPTTFPSTPAYYFRMRAFNQAGPRLRREIGAPPTLSPQEFDDRRKIGVVVDTRPMEEYLTSHIGGSLSNEFRDSYAVWLGSTVPEGAELLFVTGDDVPVDRVVDESLLVAYERFGGVLRGGISAWARAGLDVQATPLIGTAAAQHLIIDGGIALDVRELNEFATGHIEGALHIPLGSLSARIDEVPRDRPIVTYCGHGERATTGVSILERAGIASLNTLEHGFGAWQAAGRRIVT